MPVTDGAEGRAGRRRSDGQAIGIDIADGTRRRSSGTGGVDRGAQLVSQFLCGQRAVEGEVLGIDGKGFGLQRAEIIGRRCEPAARSVPAANCWIGRGRRRIGAAAGDRAGDCRSTTGSLSLAVEAAEQITVVDLLVEQGLKLA